MATEIEKCPFEHPIRAGSKVEDLNGGAVVRCEDCNATGPEKSTYAAAIKAWNKRRKTNGGAS
ncbi:MAG: hypothetical protein E5X35_11645 [Mesorhizobium sp.]|uniref:hypothetical protein n=1 Tax=unclassified Mesorhizobium TaxID=325217 RepID=UPI000FCC1205|nr:MULTISPECIES: hypothetical protein [unclassified Mesorhizobium]RUV65198.1 hypothetical protein EOA85_00095 [Mesorhizobium sp. M5C.F.Ca.IN.020.29.1.1]TIM87638.1 MAG: hypothetical protein E5Y50_11420 [Mesorhizobium sp.]TIR33311.1 MAG: hypothetical protein E5X35_11645 [Mesorhizobium sp.]